MRRTVTTDRYNKAKVAVVGGGIAGASEIEQLSETLCKERGYPWQTD